MIRKLFAFILLTSLLLTLSPGLSAAVDVTGPASNQVDRVIFSTEKKLLELSNDIYDAATEGNRQLVYHYLKQLERLTADLTVREKGNKQGWSAVRHTINQIRGGLQGGAADPDLRSNAAQLMLAFDALALEDGALWKTYHEVVSDDIDRIVKAWRRTTGDGAEAALAALQPLSSHIRLITPAALMRRDSEQVLSLQKAYSHAYKLLEAGSRGELDRVWMEQAFDSLSLAVDLLFEEPGGRTSEPVLSPVYGTIPWRWTIIVGLLILTVLTYAGWQKFRHDRGRVWKRDRSNLP